MSQAILSVKGLGKNWVIEEFSKQPIYKEEGMV